MKLSQILKWSTLGTVLLCSATSISALTLGRVRGAAILGQPLELTVPIQIAADEDASGLCFDADVFYGDNRQDPSRIVVTSENSRPGSSAVVRVLSHAHVDEPVVTVYLRSNCGLQATRRYVLLADLASEVVPTLRRSMVAPGSTFAMADPAAVVVSLGETNTRSIRNRKAARTAIAETGNRVSKSQDDGLARGPVGRANSKSLARAPTVGQPRLKLAPLDLMQELVPTLKVSSEIVFTPAESLKKKQEEAAALWRALNASPEDVLREGVRVLAMENDVKGLQDRTSKNRQTMLEMVNRLEKAHSQRYFNPLVYGLIALLVACGATFVYGWSRWRVASLRSAPWWRNQNAEETADAGKLGRVVEEGLLQPRLKQVVTRDRTSIGDPAAGLKEVDIDLQLAESAFSDLGKPAPFPLVKAADYSVNPAAMDTNMSRDFAHSGTGVLREINSQEMIDARQQADFFMTLGQYEDAIYVLEGCIHERGESNPLAYLDLLKVFHTLSRKADYDRCRGQFNQIFTGHVPEYARFNDGGSGIEDYPGVCDQIVALWPTEEVGEYIEKCLIRTPDYEQAFNLEAYRDLLMLHGVVGHLAPVKTIDLDFSF